MTTIRLSATAPNAAGYRPSGRSGPARSPSRQVVVTFSGTSAEVSQGHTYALRWFTAIMWVVIAHDESKRSWLPWSAGTVEVLPAPAGRSGAYLTFSRR